MSTRGPFLSASPDGFELDQDNTDVRGADFEQGAGTVHAQLPSLAPDLCEDPRAPNQNLPDAIGWLGQGRRDGLSCHTEMQLCRHQSAKVCRLRRSAVLPEGRGSAGAAG